MLDVVSKDIDLRDEAVVGELESAMLDEKQVDCPVVHRFGPGTYIREVHLPADTFAIGHYQNFEHMNIFLKGRVTILKENGETEELKAPMMFVGKPGRKIGYIHEDVVWLNVYATEEQDVDRLEAKFLTKSDSWVESVAAKQSVELLTSSLDKKDYELFLRECDLSEDVVRKQSENKDDMIDLPFGGYSIKVADSPIEGKGLFATANFDTYDLIGPARISGKRTIAGRYTNHAKNPNAQMVEGANGDIDLIAIKPIKGCAGGLDGEEITIDYRKALELNLKIGGHKCQV